MNAAATDAKIVRFGAMCLVMASLYGNYGGRVSAKVHQLSGPEALLGLRVVACSMISSVCLKMNVCVL
jgi:hypothetical protein